MSLRDDLIYMPENELVFDFLASLDEHKINLSDYPALDRLINHLVRLKIARYTPAELRAYKKGLTDVALALAQHAELENRVSETVLSD
ncbi:MAG: hypothetical protein ABSD10_00800 [Candidatus Saccharimonadales bacterium]|jgi:hypothetical protein